MQGCEQPTRAAVLPSSFIRDLVRDRMSRLPPRVEIGSVLFLAVKSVWNEMRPPLSFRWLGPSWGDFFHAAFLARRCALCLHPA